VPFVFASDWPSLQGYGTETKAKALVIPPSNGVWRWKTGDDDGEAVAAAYAECKKDKGNFCILYAVNNRVVFTTNGPH
jgi:hypothetical protein